MSTSTDSAEPASRTRLVTWKEPVVDVAQIAAMSREHDLPNLYHRRRS
jgi:hypothetical protein